MAHLSSPSTPTRNPRSTFLVPPPDPDRPLSHPPSSPFHPSRTSTTLSKHRSNPNLRPYPAPPSPAASKDFSREVRLRKRNSRARLERVPSAPNREEVGTGEDEIMESASEEGEEEDVFVSPSLGYRYGKKSQLRGEMSMSNLGSPIHKQATRRGSSAALLNGHNSLTNTSTPRSSTLTNPFENSDPFASSASVISGFGSATDGTLTSSPSSSSSSSFPSSSSDSSSQSAVSDGTVKPQSSSSSSSESAGISYHIAMKECMLTMRTITQQPTPSSTTSEDSPPISNQPSPPSWETHLPSPRASEDDSMDASTPATSIESQSDSQSGSPTSLSDQATTSDATTSTKYSRGPSESFSEY
ncbi:hypothetical protein L202_03172 [Cryptococcus amylolentus CBS 6039]|uniref:Uncharacterized protein n=1 Tax=Cryptococcus amylolentus CBS 6039 TaxID=1295533 RepID=A0A1E3HXU3_9TREE|nr:hypothetical protein L202_03172 [Cryptococcus amylolentus CBS 6039]ODN81077.1 hypothetical protein L202_03172 [Cryptococcus amylolentus CBS 6039]